MNIQALNQTIKTLEGVRNAVGSFTRADVDLTLGLLRREVEAQATPPAAPVQEPDGYRSLLRRVQATLKQCEIGFTGSIGSVLEDVEAMLTTPPAQPAPVQEPVGFIESLKDAQPCCGQYETCYRACTPRGKFLGHRDAQRQWVGLTPREIYNLWEDSGVPFVDWDSFASIARAIESKLREKNGGAA